MTGFISGFFLIGSLPFLPDLVIWIWSLPAISILLYVFRSQLRPFFVRFVLGLFVSTLLASIYGHNRLSSRLPESLSGYTFIVSGIVSGLPQNSTELARFDLQVNEILKEEDDEQMNDSDSGIEIAVNKVRLSWYRPVNEVKPGDRIKASVKLKTPHSLWNPNGSDYERWALTRGVDATGYIKQLVEYQISNDYQDIRYQLIQWVRQRFPHNISGSIQALWLGDKNELTDQQWQVLRDTGTTHLMVVSGLHIGVLLVVGWWLGRLINIVDLVKPGIIHNPILWPVLFALLLSGLYVYLAGFSIPTQRAWIMGLVMLGGKLIKRRVSIWQRWWLAMAVVLALQPLSYYEVGFWLSFLAVAVLLSLVSIRDRSSLITTMLRMQWWIFLLMGPVLIYLFGELKLISPIANLLAIPFISLWVSLSLPSLLLESLGFTWALDSLGELLVWFWFCLEGASGLIDWNIIGLTANEPALFFALFGSFLLLQPWSWFLKGLGVLGWMPLLFPNAASIKQGEFEAIIFDVGQGTSVLVRTESQAFLYDTGMQYRSGNTALERSVLPYLQANGVGKLDRLIISHDDNDHAGGAKAALSALQVSRIDSGMPNELSKKLNYPVKLCKAGDEWSSSGVTFRYLHPPALFEGNDNNSSCVLEVSMDGCRLLLTGDIDQSTEELLAEELRPSYWLLAGHHGSKTSSGSVLLDVVKPHDVLISAGYLNRYFHPHPSVIKRLEDYEANIFRTDRHGALRLYKGEDSQCQTEAWRQKEKPYWSTF